VDHHAPDSAVAHQQIRTTTNNSLRDSPVTAVSDKPCKGFKGGWLQPKLRRATTENGGVPIHRLINPGFHWSGFAVIATLITIPHHFLHDLHITSDFRADFMHIASTQGDQEVTGSQSITNRVVRPLHRTYNLGSCIPVRSDGIYNRLRPYPLNRKLASRVDIRDKYQVSRLQRLTKVIRQFLGPAITMRLKNHYQTSWV